MNLISRGLDRRATLLLALIITNLALSSLRYWLITSRKAMRAISRKFGA